MGIDKKNNAQVYKGLTLVLAQLNQVTFGCDPDCYTGQ